MGFKERLKKDYFGGKLYKQYEAVLQKGVLCGYSFVTLKDFDPSGTKQIILRHDIDSDIAIAKKMFAIEQSLNIRSTYYFRLRTYNKRFIDRLKKYGCEVSYHFEEIATYAYKHNLNDNEEIYSAFDNIGAIFEKNLEVFRKKIGCDCDTVASHGDFVNRTTGIINNELLTKKIREACGIYREAYDDDLMANAKYCSDGTDKFNLLCDFSEAENYYLLVHPRNWGSRFIVRLGMDTRRLFAGIKYKLGCKFHNVFRLLREIKKLPKTELVFDGEQYKDIYKYFTKPHLKYKVFKNKTIGVCLLEKPQSFEAYLSGKSRQNLRTCRNRSIKNGYRFSEIDVRDYADGILEINKSKTVRQGREMDESYFDKDAVIDGSLDKQCFGVFDNNGKIIAYCYLIEAGNFVIVSRLLGHADYLKEGVMYYMIGTCVEQWVNGERWRDVKYFFYDTFFGATAGLKKFKVDLGFVPYKVKYKLKKR